MPTIAQGCDTSTTPDTEQSALTTAAGVIQTLAARYDALPRRQRTAALVAVAGFFADLRAGGVL